MEIRTFGSYAEMERVHQKDVNDFPMVWMFGPKTEAEIMEALSKIGAKSMEECCSNGAGGIILKSDRQKYLDMLKLHEKERIAFASDEEHLCQMILSTMYSQEYGYTRDPEDTLSILGKTSADLENDRRFRQAWEKAEKKCFGKS